MMTIRSQNQIVSLPTPREILFAVIDDTIRAHRPRLIHIPRTANSSHISPKRLRDLHRKGPHTARRTFHKNLLPWSNPSLIAKPLQSRNPRDWHRRRLLKRQVPRLQPQHPLSDTHIFGKSVPFETRYPEHLVPNPKLRHLASHPLHPARNITAKHHRLTLLHPREPVPRRTFHHVQIQRIHRCRAKPDHHLITRRHGCRDLRILQELWWPVLCAQNRFHRTLPLHLLQQPPRCLAKV